MGHLIIPESRICWLASSRRRPRALPDDWWAGVVAAALAYGAFSCWVVGRGLD